MDRHELLARLPDPVLRAALRTRAPITLPAVPLPGDFHALYLGPRRLDGPALWADGVRDLAGAEEAMLGLLGARAGIADGMRVLDAGCGWGAAAVWIAEQFPACQVVAVTADAEQRAWIAAEAERRELPGLAVAAATPAGTAFDRVLARGTGDLPATDGRVLVQSAGDPPPRAGAQSWRIEPSHHARTARAWLANLDAERDEALRLIGRRHPPRTARRLLGEWRLALLSAAARPVGATQTLL